MSKCFNSFEEICAAHPLNAEHNQSFLVHQVYQHALSWADIELLKKEHPGGWIDKEGHRYYYYDIEAHTWYDYYLYDGEKWILGVDSWDGIHYAEEPTWAFSTLALLSVLNMVFLIPKQKQLIIKIEN